MGRELSFIISSLIKWGIFFGVLYLIFTNFGTFLIIIFTLLVIIYYLIYQFKKKIKQRNQSGFKFTFNGQDFSQAGQRTNPNFDFRDFEEQFRRGNFHNQNTSFGEIDEAKKFFGFSSNPSKDEIKRKYKELARKYHPDINDHGDELMQKLNHYKDVLLKAFPN